MRRSQRSARIVSVCLLGKKAFKQSANGPRTRLLLAVLAALEEQAAGGASWGPIDAIVFPGAYFRTKAFIGHLPHVGRCRRLKAEGFAKAVQSGARRLDRLTKGALLVIGCDSAPHAGEEMGDQGCVAYGRSGIVGYARKIFPADGDTTGDYLPIVPVADDYSSPYRFVRLPNGSKAMLAACYDLFGLTEEKGQPGRRSKYIRWLWSKGEYYGEEEEQPVHTLRERCINDWHHLLEEQKPNLALCAIHGFEAPALDGYWQRHGIATASAILSGHLVVGAAHFWTALPTATSSTLAAKGVPQSYIGKWNKRPLVSHKPSRSLLVKAAGLTALVRLFE